MATRAQMIADINASRPDPYAHLTEEQLMAMLNHTDPKLRDAARQILASRKPKESTTADLVNETRPIPEVAPVDEGWKGGAFDKSKMHQEVVASRRREEEREAARRAEFDKRYGEGTYDYRGAALEAMRNSSGVGPARPRDMSGVIRAAQIADLERQAAEEDAVRVHNARVAGLKRGVPASSPADLDPVEAAATEVPPDPQVGADMSSTDVLPGPRPGTVRKWNPTTKRYDIVDASTPVADEPAPFYGRSVPGRDPIDGGPAKPSRAFASQEEADAYDRRPVLAPTDIQPPGTLVNTETRLMSSPRDVDMMQRGFVPVYDANGEVTYMRAANPVGPQNVASLPGEDWTPDDREGPLGKQSVLTYTPEARERLAETQRNRSQARAARDAERQKMVVMQAQATQRPMNFLNNPNADPWAKRVLSEAMLRSGRPGATPLDVEGQQMQNMQDIAKQLAVGALQAGPAQAQLDAAERARREQRIVDMRKTAGPFMDSTWHSPAEARRRAAAALRRDHGASPDEIDMILGPAPSERQPNDGRVDGRSAAPAAPRENPF